MTGVCRDCGAVVEQWNGLWIDPTTTDIDNHGLQCSGNDDLHFVAKEAQR